ncbi:MAG: MMPL family transporter [Actinomycetota bacterium]
MLARLGRWCHDNRWRVVGAWIAVIVVLVVATAGAGQNFGASFETPDSEGGDGFDLIDEYFGGQGSGFPGRVVFRAEQGVDDPSVRGPMDAYFTELAAQDGIAVVSPYDPQAFGQISEDGTIAFAQVEAPSTLTDSEAEQLGPELKDLAPEVDFQVEFGGELFFEFHPPESEIFGLAFAIFILIAAFGSVVAMGLPIGVALGGIATGVLSVGLVSNLVEMPDFTLTLAVMIGLGVGIDYALFIVTRYRDELHAGHDSATATARAIDTAGRAVLFAGTTVVISLLGLLLIGLGFVRGLGIGSSMTVLVTMIASVTLLPALLGFIGPRIEVTKARGLFAAVLVALALVSVGVGVAPLAAGFAGLALIILIVGAWLPKLRDTLPARRVKPIEETIPYRWSRLVQRYPVWMALLGTVILLALTIPALSLRLGFSDEGNIEEDFSSRRAYDLLADGFGPGFNGPILLVAELDGPADLEAVTAEIGGTEGVAAVTPPFPNDPENPTAVIWRAFPTTSPQDVETDDLVKRLRADDALPGAQADGLDVLVTGSVAINQDFSQFLARRIPIFFTAVLLLSFLLLMTVFRSVLVAVKAVIMNMLSIGAAYGLVVAIFQWGWGIELVGLGRGGPIEPFIPMMLFAIVFGLSMDYEVFLLSRVREEWKRTGDNARSVADGLASTARVITAAAAIMVFVFGSFLLETDRVVKLFGFGLAAAIALDATIVRLLLVPATMELLGDRNWWMPKWLDRLLPELDVEGHGSDDEDPSDRNGHGEYVPRHAARPGDEPEPELVNT